MEGRSSYSAHIVFILGKTENLYIQYPRVVTKAILFFVDKELDIVDCILCAFNTVMGFEVFTFDKDMKVLLKSGKWLVGSRKRKPTHH